MYRAWNEPFYKDVIQSQFPEYKNTPYAQAFAEWRNCFVATWPNLLEEPDSEKAKAEDVKLKALISVMEVMLAKADPENAKILLQWFCDNLNENQVMFPHSLDLDTDAMAAWIEEQRVKLEEAQNNSAANDDEDGRVPTSYVGKAA